MFSVVTQRVLWKHIVQAGFDCTAAKKLTVQVETRTRACEAGVHCYKLQRWQRQVAAESSGFLRIPIPVLFSIQQLVCLTPRTPRTMAKPCGRGASDLRPGPESAAMWLL